MENFFAYSNGTYDSEEDNIPLVVHHPMSLYCFSIVCMELLQRWMTGRINHARHKYGVKVPTLYLTKQESKYANIYNSYQKMFII